MTVIEDLAPAPQVAVQPRGIGRREGWMRRLPLLPALIYTIIVDCIEGYVLSPRIMGRAVEIRPVVSLLAMIAGSELFGIWGAILAAPTMGLIQALVGAYWQYYQKTHAQEFPLQQLEQAANPQEEPAQLVVTEPAVDGPLP